MKITTITMGMPFILELLDGPSPETTIQSALALCTWVNDVFSPYRPTSEISRLATGQLKLDQASPEVQEVLAACAKLREQTSGYFNTNGPAGLDPSGYVKGWTIAALGRLLEAHGVTRYLVSIGGDITTRGRGPRNGYWHIGLTSPFDTSRIFTTVRLQTGAIATSGTYERGRHIYNPHTGELVAGALALTVIGQHIDQVDAFATAAFAMGDTGLEWLERQGLEATLVKNDRTVWSTPGFNRYTAAG